MGESVRCPKCKGDRVHMERPSHGREKQDVEFSCYCPTCDVAFTAYADICNVTYSEVESMSDESPDLAG